MKLSEIKLQLQSVFESDFQGVDTFVEKVIEPIFEDEYCALPAPADILDGKPKNVLEGSNIVSAYQVGEIDTFITIRVYDITLSDNANIARSRVGIQRFVRQQIPTDTQAFILFHYEHPEGRSWRLSYLYKNNSQADTTPAKRFTYLFSADNHARTAIERFATLVGKDMMDEQPLLKAFSVEALSDEFFYEYREHYADFVQYITGKRFVKRGKEWKEIVVHEPNEELYNAFDRNDKRVRDYVKKMMGRLVFLCFLQRKGWMGNGDNEYLFNLYDNASEDVKTDFLDRVLEPMFFGLLNTKPEERAVEFARQGWDISLITDAEKIPYLNGGLFEQDENDKVRSVFPCELFSNPSAKEVVKKYTSETFDYKTKRGVFDFFSAYNFTIDENDPDDAEVGVDPEMLGRIFENLLEDNKDKGAFYTPKEIVQYMCRESLIAYLQEDLMDDPTKHYIRKFVITHDAAVLAERWKEKVSQKLKDVKICDPAIGSGAFPMGLLRELFLCRSAIEGFEHAQVADIKRHIIQNNIYGVDLEKGAVDIARLRFWLSLVIDEESPRALPNLDFKIMQGNSLLEQYQGVDLSTVSIVLDDRKKSKVGDRQLSWFEQNVDETRKQLQDMINEYFTCEDHAHKKDLRNYIATNVESQIRSLNTDVDLNGVDVAENSHFFLWHTWFADVFKKGGFDIVIGNPPYIKEDFNSSAFVGFKESSPYYMGKMDLWYGFACYGIDILKSYGILSLIAQNNWTTSAGAKKMRNKISEDARILQMVDFNEFMVFGGSASIQTMVMSFRKDSVTDNYLIDLRRLNAGASKNNMLELLQKKQSPFCQYLCPTFVRRIRTNSYFTFSSQEGLLDKIALQPNRFTDKEATNGIHPHYDFVNKKIQAKHPNVKIGEGIFGLSTQEKDNLNLTSAEAELVKPYYTSEQVKRYYTSEVNTLWIIYTGSEFKKPSSMDSYPNLKKHLDKYDGIISSDNRPYGLHRARKESFFQKEKIAVLRKCVGKPSFSYSDFDCYLSATFYVLKTKRWNMKFLTGLLNSTLIEFWLRNRGKMQGENFQLDKEPLLNIPLPSTSCLQLPIITLVDEILSAKKANPGADTSALESEIDHLVYDLYGLTEDEIAIVEGTNK